MAVPLLVDTIGATLLSAKTSVLVTALPALLPAILLVVCGTIMVLLGEDEPPSSCVFLRQGVPSPRSA